MDLRDHEALEDNVAILDRGLDSPSLDLQRLRETIHLQDAVIRFLQVLGEASKWLSCNRRILNPTVPWRRVLGSGMTRRKLIRSRSVAAAEDSDKE